MSDLFGNIEIESAPNKTKKSAPKKRARKQPSQKPPREKKTGSPLLGSAVIIVLMLVCYGAVGYYGVPRLLSSWLPQKVRNETALDLSIHAIAFNPFTFTLQFGETDLRDSSSKQKPVVSLRSLTTRLAPLSLLRGDFVTKNLNIDELFIHIIRNKDASYNITPIIQTLKRSDNTDFMDFSELPFLFSLNNIAISNSKIHFEDIPNSNTHSVEQIELTLPNLSNFSYQAGHYIQPGFSAIVNGSPVELTGQTTFKEDQTDSKDRKTNLACSLNNIDISRYFSYLPAHLPLEITKGTADGNLMLTFTPGAKNEKLLVEFSLQASDLEVNDKNKLYALKVPSAKFEGAVQPVTGDTYIKQIILREPHLRSEQGKLLKMPSLFSNPAEKNADPALPVPQKPEISIDLLLADSGSYTSFDKDSKKDRDTWQDIHLSLKNFTSSSKPKENSPLTSFRLSSEKRDSHTTLSWQGQIKPKFHLSGDLRIDSLPTGTLFDWLNIQGFDTPSGTSNLEAHLVLANTSNTGKPVSMAVKEGTIILHDLTLEHGKSEWYSAPVTRLDNFSATDSKVNLGEVRLKNSAISLNVDSLPSIFDHVAKKDSKLSLKALEFTGSLQLTKKSMSVPPLQFNSVNLQAINLDDPGKTTERNNLTFKAGLSKNGEIQAKGKVILDDFSTYLTTAFTDLPSSQILPWFGKVSALTETRGGLAGKGTFIYPEISFSGQVAINKGQFDNTDTPVISWKKLALKDFRFSRTPLHIGASEASFVGPEVNFLRKNESKHPVAALASFLNGQLPARGDGKKKGVNMSSLEIQKVSVSDGTVKIIENRLTPPWTGTVSYFRGTLDNLVSKRNNKTTSPFSFSGNLDGIHFSLEGELNPFDSSSQGNALFNMKGYPIPAFQKQLLREIDIDSSLGDFSLTTRSDWSEGQISERSQILFDNVKPLSRNAAAAFTLALLQDNDQQFELLMNSRRYFEEKSDPLFTETLTTLQKLIIKASFSPYLVATGDFSDIADSEYAEFVPGQVVLSDQGQAALTRFAALLSEHPNIGITITGGVDSIIDRSALYDELEQVEMERVSAENHRRAMALNEAREKYTQKILEEREKSGSQEIAETDLPPELIAPFTPLEPEPIVIEDTMLENLAAKRAQVIVDFFTTKLALKPERIKVAPQQILSEENTSGNRVNFKLNVY